MLCTSRREHIFHLHYSCNFSLALGLRISIKNNYPIRSPLYNKTMFPIICSLVHKLFKLNLLHYVFAILKFCQMDKFWYIPDKPPFSSIQDANCPSEKCSTGKLVCLALQVTGYALPACLLTLYFPLDPAEGFLTGWKKYI